MQGQAVSAAALSPRALYVAAGIGNSLVAMAPDGRRAWSHPAGGRVVAIAWAPDGIPDRVHRPRRASLRPARHLRERDPRHDDRPLGASRAAVVAGQLARLRVRGRRRHARSSTTSATRAGMSSREPAGYRRRVRAVGGLRSRWRSTNGVSLVEQIGLPATSPRTISRRSVGSTADSPSRCPASHSAVIHFFGA